jgi:hypothetical protein
MNYLQYNHNDNLLMHSMSCDHNACARHTHTHTHTHIKRRCKKNKPTCRHIWMWTREKQKQRFIVLPFLYAKFATPSPFERIKFS